ncbi:MAG TPA: hypothetical protein VM406_04390 [Noviherbaspirillum sp.]|nr:hypothetical protein [Noviherbaspirillum sp.]
MPSKERYDQYAIELNQRFDDLVQWAIANWPREDFPLMQSDFDQARRQIAEIAGPRLGEPGEQQDGKPVVPDPPGLDDGRKGEFRNLNPMPWP